MGKASREKQQRRILRATPKDELEAMPMSEAKKLFGLAVARIVKQRKKAQNFKGGKGGEIVSTSREGYKHPSYSVKPRMLTKKK